MNNACNLGGKVALVTGSSSGIGAAIAMRLGQAGARVILHGRTESPHLQSTAERISQAGGQVSISTADFSDPGQMDPFIESTWQNFGPIDVLINNAGGDVLTGEPADWSFEQKLDYLLKTDVIATLRLSRGLGRKMIDHRNDDSIETTASIINIGWDQANQGMAGDSGEMFATTKGAIMSMTLSLAQSLAPQVRVNCIAPGWIQTAWGNQASIDWDQRAKNESLMNRWGQPDDIAATAAFLASEDASFISGQIVCVNGGFKYS